MVRRGRQNARGTDEVRDYARAQTGLKSKRTRKEINNNSAQPRPLPSSKLRHLKKGGAKKEGEKQEQTYMRMRTRRYNGRGKTNQDTKKARNQLSEG